MKLKIANILHASILATALLAAGCTAEVDDSYSRFPGVIEISASSSEVVINEDTPDDIALTVSWTNAADYGKDFITTYQYKWDLSEKTAEKSEYEDMGNFVREYTHGDLQKMLINDFGYKTSTWGTLIFTVTASYEGPHIVLPDEDRVTVRVKTDGAKQFAADKVFIGGDAVDGGPVELTPNEQNPSIYRWTGNLSAGSFNFPITYGDENNVIIPESGRNTDISATAMPAIVVGQDEQEAEASWTIPEKDSYRVLLNFSSRTVTVTKTSDIFEFDRILLDGAAAEGLEETAKEVTQTLENENLYAWRAELKAGALYLPIEFEGATSTAIVPAGESTDLADGQTVPFTQVSLSQTGTRHWNVPSEGIYRIVLDTDLKTITIYSPEKDLKNKKVTYNNTADGINPYTQEVTELWMWGGFNNFATESGMKTGFSSKYTLKQSLADPNVFVYFGDVLPKQSGNDPNNGNAPMVGFVKFLVSNKENNVYAYGSTADAKRNDHSGYFEAKIGIPATLVEGQGDNRYAYFIIPEGDVNFVVVDIENLTIIFDQK